VPVVVRVRPADPDRRHPYQHVPGPASVSAAPPSRFDLARRVRRPASGYLAKVLCASQSPC
jgi:hypothetical protein